MTRSRSGLLAGRWRIDHTDDVTPMHLFEPHARTEVAPAAMCGSLPRSMPELTSLRLTNARSAAPEDCTGCRAAIGEAV